MLYCKNCSGFLYEEEIFKEDDGTQYMQVGCLICSEKLYIHLKTWNKFKKDLEKAINVVKKRKAIREKALSSS
jgi:RNase P subunit RPR2